MKKILSIVVIMLLMLSVCNISYASTVEPTIAIENSSGGEIGDTVLVAISLPQGSNAAGGSFNLVYDSTMLSFGSATFGNLVSGYSTTVNQQYAENKVRVNFAGTTAVDTNGGELVVVEFEILAYGTANFTTENFTLFDSTSVEIECSQLSASVNISEPVTIIKGDIFADGLVNSKDAVKLSQYLAKWDVQLTDNEKKAADVFADDVINSKDAVKLSQYLAKWDITLD